MLITLALALAGASACDRRANVGPDPASTKSCAPCASNAPQGSIVTTIDFHPSPPLPPEHPFPPGAAPMPMETLAQVTIQSSGDVFVNGAPAPADADLVKAVRAALTAGTTRVVVLADRTVPYGKVVHVIDVAKSAGASTISLGVEVMPTPRP